MKHHTNLFFPFFSTKAAIVLSASVTFLSLPGLDTVARTAGMVAVLFAAFTMVATGVSVLRHKADMERPVSHVNYQYESLSVISVCIFPFSFHVPFFSCFLFVKII